MSDKPVLPIIVERTSCWFFDMECLHPKSDLEIQVELHNEKLTLGDYKNLKSPFESTYSLDAIYTIPVPDTRNYWCDACMQAIGLREDHDLGHGKPQSEEE